MSTDNFNVYITNTNISDIHVIIPDNVNVKSIKLVVGMDVIYEIKGELLKFLIRNSKNSEQYKFSIVKTFISCLPFSLSYYHIAKIVFSTEYGDPNDIVVDITKDATIYETKPHTTPYTAHHVTYSTHVIKYKRPVYNGESYVLKPATLKFDGGFVGVLGT